MAIDREEILTFFFGAMARAVKHYKATLARQEADDLRALDRLRSQARVDDSPPVQAPASSTHDDQIARARAELEELRQREQVARHKIAILKQHKITAKAEALTAEALTRAHTETTEVVDPVVDGAHESAVAGAGDSTAAVAAESAAIGVVESAASEVVAEGEREAFAGPSTEIDDRHGALFVVQDDDSPDDGRHRQPGPQAPPPPRRRGQGRRDLEGGPEHAIDYREGSAGGLGGAARSERPIDQHPRGLEGDRVGVLVRDFKAQREVWFWEVRREFARLAFEDATNKAEEHIKILDANTSDERTAKRNKMQSDADSSLAAAVSLRQDLETFTKKVRRLRRRGLPRVDPAEVRRFVERVLREVST